MLKKLIFPRSLQRRRTSPAATSLSWYISWMTFLSYAWRCGLWMDCDRERRISVTVPEAVADARITVVAKGPHTEPRKGFGLFIPLASAITGGWPRCGRVRSRRRLAYKDVERTPDSQGPFLAHRSRSLQPRPMRGKQASAAADGLSRLDRRVGRLCGRRPTPSRTPALARQRAESVALPVIALTEPRYRSSDAMNLSTPIVAPWSCSVVAPEATWRGGVACKIDRRAAGVIALTRSPRSGSTAAQKERGDWALPGRSSVPKSARLVGGRSRVQASPPRPRPADGSPAK